MDLIILRHGEAGTQIPPPGKDEERVLTDAGKKEVEDIAKSIRALKLKIGPIATSPVTRSMETAKIVAKTLNKTKDIEAWDELKPEGERSVFYDRLSKMKEDSSILIVGHEPYIGNLIGDLIAGKSSCRIAIKKGGMARISISTLNPKPIGKLKWLLTPKQIRKLS